jgi:hypothetical protein
MTTEAPAATPLRKLSDILDLSLVAIGDELEISKAYAHQLRSGERELPPKLIWRLVTRFGIHPDSLIDTEVTPLLDCDGSAYTCESYHRHLNPQPSTWEDHESDLLMLKQLFNAAADAGRLNLLRAVLRDQVLRLLDQMPDLDRSFREQSLCAPSLIRRDEEISSGDRPDGDGRDANRILSKDLDSSSLFPKNWKKPDIMIVARSYFVAIEFKTSLS